LKKLTKTPKLKLEQEITSLLAQEKSLLRKILPLQQKLEAQKIALKPA